MSSSSPARSGDHIRLADPWIDTDQIEGIGRQSIWMGLGSYLRPSRGSRLSCRDGGTPPHPGTAPRHAHDWTLPEDFSLARTGDVHARMARSGKQRRSASPRRPSLRSTSGRREHHRGRATATSGSGPGDRSGAGAPRQGRAYRGSMVCARAAWAEPARTSRPRLRRPPGERRRVRRHRPRRPYCWGNAYQNVRARRTRGLRVIQPTTPPLSLSSPSATAPT
jgi:hypothetical protein